VLHTSDLDERLLLGFPRDNSVLLGLAVYNLCTLM